LKGVAPPEVKTTDIYKGIIPFVIIQMVVLVLVVLYPQTVTCLPEYFLDGGPISELSCWAN
jgi:TRAP-type mannitol/chloroaromatic compound transport system permease large subunit